MTTKYKFTRYCAHHMDDFLHIRVEKHVRTSEFY